MSEYDRDGVPDRWQASTDGGHSWRDLAPAEDEAVRQARPAGTPPDRSACVPGDARHCYRLVDGRLAVEETTDGGGSWQLSWEVPDRQRELLADEYQNLDDPGRHLVSMAVAVAPVPGGHTVVVANGRDGYAVRDVTGTWQRIGFGTLLRENQPPRPGRAVPLPKVPIRVRTAEIPLGSLTVAVVLTAGAGAAAFRGPRRRYPLWLIPAGIATGTLAAVGAFASRGAALGGRPAAGPLVLPGPVWAAALAWSGAIATLAAAAALLILSHRRPAPAALEHPATARTGSGRAPLAVVAVALAAGGAATLLLLDTADDPVLYSRSAGSAAALAVLGALLAVPLSIRARRAAVGRARRLRARTEREQGG